MAAFKKISLVVLFVLTGCENPRSYDSPRTGSYEPVTTDCRTLVDFVFRLCRLPPGWVVTGGEYSLSEERRYEVSELWFADTPVTNRDYEKYDPDHERSPFSALDTSPATNITWHDAKGFADWFGEKCKVKARLPTSVEWHYACLGGQDGPFPWGPKRYKIKTRQKEIANIRGTAAVTVRRYKPNNFGLYDMVGNVLEFTGQQWSAESADYPVRLYLPSEPEYEKFKEDLVPMKNCSAKNYSLRFCECYYVTGTGIDSEHPLMGFRIAVDSPPVAPCEL